MKGLARASTVAHVQRLAHEARGSEVGDRHDLPGAVGRLHPLEIAELCEAWREMRGIVRRRDCVDVRAEVAR